MILAGWIIGAIVLAVIAFWIAVREAFRRGYESVKARWAARPALNPIDLSAAIAAVKADVVSQINAGNAD